MTGKIKPVRRILGVMMAFLVFCGTGIGVSAAGTLPDLSATGSVLVTPETSDGLKASDGTLTLYKVADVVWDDGNMVYEKTEPFEESEWELDINNTSLAAMLALYASQNHVEGTAYAIPSDGSVKMEDLSMGLYLVVQTEASTGFSLMNPFLVGLPLETENGWQYDDIDALPKMEKITQKTTEEPKTVNVIGYKIWDDEDDAYNARPDSITVELYADDVRITSKEVTEDDGWVWSWTGLEKYVNGTEIEYTVLEEDVSGYTASYDGYNITNTYVKPTKQTEQSETTSGGGSGTGSSGTGSSGDSSSSGGTSSVKTADTTNVDLWMRVLLVSGFALAGLLVYEVYRKKSGRRA